MNRREVRRRALFIASELIVSDVESGLDLASYTDGGSDAEARLLETELRAVAAQIRRRIPAEYRIDPETAGGA